MREVLDTGARGTLHDTDAKGIYGGTGVKVGEDDWRMILSWMFLHDGGNLVDEEKQWLESGGQWLVFITINHC